MRLIALVLLFSVPLSGCFTYVPVTNAPSKAARVRVQLSAPLDFKLLDLTANDVIMAEGEMVRSDEREVILSAMELRARSGYPFAARGESITIPRERIAAVQQQKVSVTRTLLLGGVMAAVASLAGRLATSNGGSGGDGGGSPPVTN